MEVAGFHCILFLNGRQTLLLHWSLSAFDTFASANLFLQRFIIYGTSEKTIFIFFKGPQLPIISDRHNQNIVCLLYYHTHAWPLLLTRQVQPAQVAGFLPEGKTSNHICRANCHPPVPDCSVLAFAVTEQPITKAEIPWFPDPCMEIPILNIETLHTLNTSSIQAIHEVSVSLRVSFWWGKGQWRNEKAKGWWKKASRFIVSILINLRSSWSSSQNS